MAPPELEDNDMYLSCVHWKNDDDLLRFVPYALISFWRSSLKLQAL